MNETINQEAKYIYSLAKGEKLGALQILENQLNVLYSRAQVLMSLAGIVITVTGFSGRIIAATSKLSQILIITGLSTVLISAIWVYARVMGIRWITSETGDSIEKTLHDVLQRRNCKTRAYKTGGIILCIGLVIYTIAFALMLLHPNEFVQAR
jgi:hypothetical protein